MGIKYLSRILFVAFRMLLLSSALSSNSPNLDRAKAPIAKAFLWEISGNGLRRPSYLLGTTHTGCAKKLALTKQQRKALNSVDQLYTEITKSEYQVSDHIDNNKIANGKTLQDLIGSANHRKVKSFFVRNSKAFPKEVKEYNITRLFPLAFDVIGGNGLKEAYVKYCRTKNVTSKEEVLLSAADDLRLSTKGIETLADRAKNEENMQLQDLIYSLMVSMERYQLRKSTDLIDQIVDSEEIFDSQDLEKIFYSDILDSFSAQERVERVDIEGRNRLWLPRMRHAMVQKPTFFGFGASHLVGKNGLISLLESEGYQLRPIFDTNK
jgi:uncharacterized protein